MPNETKAVFNYEGEYHRLLEIKKALESKCELLCGDCELLKQDNKSLEEQYKSLERTLSEANQEIAFLKGQVKAFEFCIAKGGVNNA